MEFTEKELDNLSVLARIDIRAKEKPKMLADMQAILGYISEIKGAVNSGQLSVDSNTVFNVVREDVETRETGSNTDAILDNAPAVKDGYVKVEQVLK